MAWTDDADLLNREIRDTFGEAIAYTPEGGQVVPIVAVFDEAAAVVEMQANVPVQTTRPALTVRLADLATAPGEGDRFVRVGNGKAYEVHAVELEGQGTAKLIAFEV